MAFCNLSSNYLFSSIILAKSLILFALFNELYELRPWGLSSFLEAFINFLVDGYYFFKSICNIFLSNTLFWYWISLSLSIFFISRLKLLARCTGFGGAFMSMLGFTLLNRYTCIICSFTFSRSPMSLFDLDWFHIEMKIEIKIQII